MSARDIPGRSAISWLYDAWLNSNPPHGAIVAEIGIALGRSIAYLCERADAHGRDDLIIYGVDPFDSTHRNGEQQQWADEVGGDFALYCQHMMRSAPKAFERVRILRLTSVDAYPIIHGADLIVLDADHSYEAVRTELDLYGEAPWIGGDDFVPDYPGVEQAVREMYGSDFEYRDRGGGWEKPDEWIWGTWLRRNRK